MLNPGKKARRNKINELKINDICITGDFEISNAMNEYFCTVGKNLADKLPKGKDASSYLQSSIKETICLNPTTEEEISEEI